MEKVLDVNYAEFIGNLVSPFEFSEYARGEVIYSSSILVKRGSGMEECIPVSISKGLLDTIDADILSGKIKIQGFIFCRTRKNRLTLTIRITKKIVPQSDEVPDKNFVKIIGEICKLPLFFPNDIAVCKFMVSSKEEHYPKCYIPIIALRNLAYQSRKCNLKDRLYIKGKLRSISVYNTLDDDKEEPREVYRLYADKMKKIGE